MTHTCSTLLIRCMDFRLGPAIRDYLNERNLYGDTDIVSVAGAAKYLVSGDDVAKPFLESQIELSKTLHEISRIILMNHTDCGGYGGRAAFSSAEEERAKHLADLHVAKGSIEQKHPSINVELALANIHKDGKVVIESV